MFTGIITDIVSVKHSQLSDEGLKLTFERPASWKDLEVGESVSTDGVCLTVATLTKQDYGCILMPATLHKTTFGLQLPKAVNVERALRAGERLSGHFVQGHVDEVGHIKRVVKTDGWQVDIEFSQASATLVVSQGSITVNGVSLTIAKLEGDVLSVALVSYTLEHTTLDSLVKGDPVNLEFDIIGKYISRISKGYHRATSSAG